MLLRLLNSVAKSCIQTHKMCLIRDNLYCFSNKIAELHNKNKDMPFYFIGYIYLCKFKAACSANK